MKDFSTKPNDFEAPNGNNGTADGETVGKVRAECRATRRAGSVWGTLHFTTKPRQMVQCPKVRRKTKDFIPHCGTFEGYEDE